MIDNLDSAQVEKYPENKTIERTIRDWESSQCDGNGINMNCNVVNGGYDQQSYLVFPPHHEANIRSEFNDYRRQVFPFTQWKERFRESIGLPPSVIHVDTKVMAILSFSDKICTSTAK